MNMYRLRKRTFKYEDTYNLLRMPLPETDAELEVASFAYFGKALHLSILRLSSYDVKEPYDSYHGDGWPFDETSCEGYDHSAAFWNWVCGDRTCGGIAANSYGQFKRGGHRHQLRLKRWITNRQKGTNYLRKPFKRLAQSVGFGREQNDSR